MGDTIEIRGIEFDADDLEAALDQLPNTTDGIAQEGEVFVAGDGFHKDDHVKVTIVENVVTPKGGHGFFAHDEVWTDIDNIRDDIEDGRMVPFVDYLREEVFTAGEYVIDTEGYGDARVAEYDDGSGFIMEVDMNRAEDDNNVGFVTVHNGWLHLTDERE